MTTITTTYGQTEKIHTIAAGHGRIDATDMQPQIDIIKDGDEWFAMFVGSARHQNFLSGWKITGGHTTRKDAAIWLLEGGH